MAEKKKSDAELVQVATETKPGYQLPEGQVVTQEELLLLIYNKVNNIEKSVA